MWKRVCVLSMIMNNNIVLFIFLQLYLGQEKRDSL